MSLHACGVRILNVCVSYKEEKNVVKVSYKVFLAGVKWGGGKVLGTHLSNVQRHSLYETSKILDFYQVCCFNCVLFQLPPPEDILLPH